MDSMTRGVLSGLGSLAVTIVYIVSAVILGINLLKRGSFYGLLKNVGEQDKTNSQVANVVGIIIYSVIVLLLLPIINNAASKLFGG